MIDKVCSDCFDLMYYFKRDNEGVCIDIFFIKQGKR